MDLKNSPKHIRPARMRMIVSIFIFAEGVTKYMPFGPKSG
jgi:hypothetical protein